MAISVSYAGTALLAAVFFSSALHAALPIVSGNETVKFSEEFDNNKANWSEVAVVNGTGTVATAQACIDKSHWSPSISSDGTAVRSQFNFPQPLKLSDGPISIYVRARVDNINSVEGSRFSFSLHETQGNRFFGLLVRPRSHCILEYRSENGKGVSTNGDRILFKDASTSVDFKLTLSEGETPGGLAMLEAFRYDPDSSSYLSIGEAVDVVDLVTREFGSISLFSRNGDIAYLDSVIVTQHSK